MKIWNINHINKYYDIISYINYSNIIIGHEVSLITAHMEKKRKKKTALTN